jgi:hypothetical protein
MFPHLPNNIQKYYRVSGKNRKERQKEEIRRGRNREKRKSSAVSNSVRCQRDTAIFYDAFNKLARGCDGSREDHTR